MKPRRKPGLLFAGVRSRFGRDPVDDCCQGELMVPPPL